jgi:hypothetical protein
MAADQGIFLPEKELFMSEGITWNFTNSHWVYSNSEAADIPGTNHYFGGTPTNGITTIQTSD